MAKTIEEWQRQLRLLHHLLATADELHLNDQQLSLANLGHGTPARLRDYDRLWSLQHAVDARLQKGALPCLRRTSACSPS